jgi:hypothetical protein
MADVAQDGDRHALGRPPEGFRLCRPEVLAFHRKHVTRPFEAEPFGAASVS